jgi:UrcA family protein
VKSILLFAASLTLLGPAVVQAETSADSVQVSQRVSYRDLNLSDPGDAAVMLQRLRDAALETCGASPFSVPDYRRAVEASACYRDSLDRAVDQLGVPAVSRLHQSASSVASN